VINDSSVIRITPGSADVLADSHREGGYSLSLWSFLDIAM